VLVWVCVSLLLRRLLQFVTAGCTVMVWLCSLFCEGCVFVGWFGVCCGVCCFLYLYGLRYLFYLC